MASSDVAVFDARPLAKQTWRKQEHEETEDKIQYEKISYCPSPGNGLLRPDRCALDDYIHMACCCTKITVTVLEAAAGLKGDGIGAIRRGHELQVETPVTIIQHCHRDRAT